MTPLERVFIKPRDRQYEKWTLSYDHYALLSKYIYDYKTLINFVRVCTRTTAPFNMHCNLGVNIKYPEDWSKLHTHVIHTDRKIEYPFFIDAKIKKYDGSLKSFGKYLDSGIYVVLEKLARGANLKVLFYEKFFPKELITLVNSYIIAFYNRIHKCCTGNQFYNTRKKTCIDVNKVDLLLQYDTCGYAVVSRDDIKVVIADAMKDKGKNVHRLLVSDIMSSIIEDISYIDTDHNTLKVRDINLPLRTTNMDLQSVDLGRLANIVTGSRILFERHSKCTICGISTDNIMYETKSKITQPKYLLESGLAMNNNFDKDHASLCIANMACFSNSTRRDFIVVSLCRPLYMYVAKRDVEYLEPIGEYSCYYKGTNIIVTYCRIRSYLFEVVEDIKLLDRRMPKEHESPYDSYGDERNDLVKMKSRFITDLYVNRIDVDKFNVDHDTDLSSFSVLLPFITLKYNCMVKSVTSRNCIINDTTTRLLQEKTRADLLERTYDVNDIAIDDYIMDCFDVFHEVLIVSCDIDDEWYKNGCDDDVFVYIQGKVYPVTECMDSEYVKKLVNIGNPLVKYIVTKDNKFMFNKKVYSFDDTESWNVALGIENCDIKNAVRKFDS